MNSQPATKSFRLPVSRPLVLSLVALAVGLSHPSLSNQGVAVFDQVLGSPITDVEMPEKEASGDERSEGAGEVVKIAPGSIPEPSRKDESATGSSPLDTTGEPTTEKIIQYLWNVYQRSPTKRDGHGDFTWKDQVAASRLGMSVPAYVIGGMDPDFQEQLYQAGLAMDLAGIHWTILSGFRDDYRQSIAIGFKAHRGNSFHGGSIATGGYGYGCAADLASADGLSNHEVWQWLALHGEEFGLHRPLPSIDPAHVVPRGDWHQFAAALRRERTMHDDSGTSKTDDSASTNTIVSSADIGTVELKCTHAITQKSNQLPSTGIKERVSRTRYPDDLPYSESSTLVRDDRFRSPMTVVSTSANVAALTTSKALGTPNRLEHMWFIQLTGAASEEVALAAYYRLQRKYLQVLGAYRPLVIRAAGTSYGWYRARIAMATRPAADKLCASLRAAGGDCLVLPK
jgi:hypothetical protein